MYVWDRDKDRLQLVIYSRTQEIMVVIQQLTSFTKLTWIGQHWLCATATFEMPGNKIKPLTSCNVQLFLAFVQYQLSDLLLWVNLLKYSFKFDPIKGYHKYFKSLMDFHEIWCRCSWCLDHRSSWLGDPQSIQ